MSEQKPPVINVSYVTQQQSSGVDLLAWLKVVVMLLVLFGLMNACSLLV